MKWLIYEVKPRYLEIFTNLNISDIDNSRTISTFLLKIA